MKKRLSIDIDAADMEALDEIAAGAGRTRTDIIRGMIAHWAAVRADHISRGFIVVPAAGRSFAAAMVADRSGAFDAPAPGAGAPAGSED